MVRVRGPRAAKSDGRGAGPVEHRQDAVPPRGSPRSNPRAGLVGKRRPACARNLHKHRRPVGEARNAPGPRFEWSVSLRRPSLSRTPTSRSAVTQLMAEVKQLASLSQIRLVCVSVTVPFPQSTNRSLAPGGCCTPRPRPGSGTSRRRSDRTRRRRRARTRIRISPNRRRPSSHLTSRPTVRRTIRDPEVPDALAIYCAPVPDVLALGFPAVAATPAPAPDRRSRPAA